MAHANLSSVAIPQAVIAGVMADLKKIQDALAPYMVALTNDERISLAKMGDKTLAFVEKVADYTQSNANFAPSFMDVDEFTIDVTNSRALEPILKTAEQVATALNDTAMVSGSEAYTASLMYYNNVKQADKNGIANARQVYEDLSQRFPGRAKKKPTVTP